MRKLVLFITITFLWYASSVSCAGESSKTEEAPAPNLWWIAFGMGSGEIRDSVHIDAIQHYSPMTAYLSFSYNWSETVLLLTVRSCSIYDFPLFGVSIEGVNDLGLLFGLVGKTKYAYISLSTGVGYLFGTYIPQGEDRYPLVNYQRSFDTVGLPVECQVFLTPFRAFGVGLVGFANLNLMRNFWGLSAAIQFGRLYS